MRPEKMYIGLDINQNILKVYFKAGPYILELNRLDNYGTGRVYEWANIIYGKGISWSTLMRGLKLKLKFIDPKLHKLLLSNDSVTRMIGAELITKLWQDLQKNN